MYKIVASLFLIITLISCHQNKYVPIERDWEVFYDSPKPHSYYRNLDVASTNSIMPISIVAVGDIMLGEHVTQYLDNYGVDYPFDSTRTYLTDAHFTIGNLEAPFSKTGTKSDKRFAFKIDPRYAKGLPAAGFDVFTLANNHILDYGAEALKNTFKTLDSLQIKYCGAGVNYQESRQPAIFEINGVKVAFLGYSMTFPREFWARDDTAGTCYPLESDMIEMVEYCEKVAQYTIASFHWGQELRNTPKDYQQYFAHLAIDAGADLILGHHPHILQGLEIYKNRLIIYSLGNFAFGSYSYKAKDSIILKTYLNGKGLLYARVIPISVYNAEVVFQPTIMKTAKADSVISYLNEISLELNSQYNIIDNDRIIWGNWYNYHDSLTAFKDQEIAN